MNRFQLVYFYLSILFLIYLLAFFGNVMGFATMYKVPKFRNALIVTVIISAILAGAVGYSAYVMSDWKLCKAVEETSDV